MLKCDKFKPSHFTIYVAPFDTPVLPNKYKFEKGWGNGYVKLPPDHKWWGLKYEDIDVDVHGGLTYGSMDKDDINYVIGFDAAHYGDSLERWPKEEVERETLRLLEQCL